MTFLKITLGLALLSALFVTAETPGKARAAVTNMSCTGNTNVPLDTITIVHCTFLWNGDPSVIEMKASMHSSGIGVPVTLTLYWCTWNGNALVGGPCPLLTAIYHGANSFDFDGAGRYWDDVTVYGYYVSSLYNVWPLNTVGASTQGVELCNGTSPQMDWNLGGNSPNGVLPWTLNGSGGYANGLFSCLGGQAITAVDGWLLQGTEGGVTPNDNQGHYHCITLKPNITGDPNDPNYSNNMCPY